MGAAGRSFSRFCDSPTTLFVFTHLNTTLVLVLIKRRKQGYIRYSAAGTADQHSAVVSAHRHTTESNTRTHKKPPHTAISATATWSCQSHGLRVSLVLKRRKPISLSPTFIFRENNLSREHIVWVHSGRTAYGADMRPGHSLRTKRHLGVKTPRIS